MKYKKSKAFIFALLSGLLLVGCGGGGSSVSSATNTTTTSSDSKGYYLDSGIEGVRYICGSISGITSKGGEFNLEVGKECSLFLNSIKLRSVKTTFNGIKIIETNITVARFLQSLDVDGDPSNGITILPEVASRVSNFIPTSDSEVKEFVDTLKSEVSSYNGEFVTLSEAKKHLNQTIQANQPVADNLNITINEDSSAKIELNATDPQNYPLSYSVTAKPQNGTLSGTAPNLTYTPNPNFNGVDKFTYEVTNPQGLKATATVTITVSPVNDAPIADDLNVTTAEDNTLAVDISKGVNDVDGDALSYSITTQPQNGTLSGTAPNLTYTPNPNFNGVDSFSFKVSDGSKYSKDAKVNITITPVDDAPTAEDLNSTAYNGIESNITLLGADIDSNTLSYSISNSPANGTVVVEGNIAKYTPDRDFSGVDTFEYKVSDGSLSATATVTVNVIDKYIFTDSSSSDYSIIELGDENISKTVRLDDNRSLYIIFTNADDVDRDIEINSSAPAQETSQESVTAPLAESLESSISSDVPEEITKFNNEDVPPQDAETISKESISAPLAETTESEGDKKLFYYYHGETNATLRKVVDANTSFGVKTLKIWVADDTFGDDCNKSKCLTQDMVDEMADAFLKEGENNDIYDWVTNIYGEEWGPHSSSALIPDNDEITIFLLDINSDDNMYGGTLGYFWAMENYTKDAYDKSNERVMFFIDSVLYANRGDDGTNDFWKIRLHSTLVHELQHMIHYYQRNVKRGVPSDTWFNEMLSVATQDVVADKVGDNAVRGIDPADGTAGTPGIRGGRFPGFNANMNKSLTLWNSSWSYSLVGSFGTYLSRNYGGVKVLQDLQHSDLSDEKDAIVDVVNSYDGGSKTFEDILREWAVGVMLSNFDNLPDTEPRYNFGDFLVVDLNGISYNLGSINFFNYSPLPQFSTTSGTVLGNSNYYYKVGENLKGDVDINISMPPSIRATLIVK